MVLLKILLTSLIIWCFIDFSESRAQNKSLFSPVIQVNNSVITLQHKLFSRSNLSFMFINKQETKDYNFSTNDNTYNRVIGLDYRLASEDNAWVGKYFIHKSFSPNIHKKDYSAGAHMLIGEYGGIPFIEHCNKLISKSTYKSIRELIFTSAKPSP